MQIENFKIFADLVETKSFSKAAKLNGITQSAVSQQARSMERNFKTLMIDRSQKQFNLTREGQRIYEAAKEILPRLREAGERAAGDEEGHQRHDPHLDHLLHRPARAAALHQKVPARLPLGQRPGRIPPLEPGLRGHPAQLG
jgi:DNA-binding transcriptional LysR family regulator